MYFIVSLLIIECPLLSAISLLHSPQFAALMHLLQSRHKNCGKQFHLLILNSVEMFNFFEQIK